MENQKQKIFHGWNFTCDPGDGAIYFAEMRKQNGCVNVGKNSLIHVNEIELPIVFVKLLYKRITDFENHPNAR